MDHQLEKSMGLAHAFRQLRNVELEEARRDRGLRDRCQDADARAFLDRRLRAYVTDARKWNRLMIRQQKNIREALFARRFNRFVANHFADRAATVRRSNETYIGQRH